MVGAEHPLLVGQQLLRTAAAPRAPRRSRPVQAAMLLRVAERVGMVGRRAPAPGRAAAPGTAAAPRAPRRSRPVQAAMLLRVMSVSGWSAPSTRSWSGSSSWNSRSASRASPVSPGPGGDVVAGSERVGMVGAEHALLVGQQLLEQPQRLARLAGLPGPGGDVVAGRERVGMVGAEHPLLVGQQLLEQPQRLARLAGLARSSRRCCCGW